MTESVLKGKREKLAAELFEELKKEYPEILTIGDYTLSDLNEELVDFWGAFADSFWEKKNIDVEKLSSEEFAKLKAVELLTQKMWSEHSDKVDEQELENDKDVGIHEGFYDQKLEGQEEQKKQKSVLDLEETNEEIAKQLYNFAMKEFSDEERSHIYDYDTIVRPFFLNEKGIDTSGSYNWSSHEAIKLDVIKDLFRQKLQEDKLERGKKEKREVIDKLVKCAQNKGLKKIKSVELKVFCFENGIPIPSGETLFLVALVNEKLNELKEEKFSSEEFDEKLFQKLRNLRKQISEEENVAPYVVFHDSTLKEIVTILPKTKDEMMQIEGMGSSKIEKYGQKFLDVIAEYSKD